MSRLAPLSEEPAINEEDDEVINSGKGQTWKKWIKTHFSHSLLLFLFTKKSENDLKILLSVLGCPLLPVSVFHRSTTTPHHAVSSSAQYIIKRFTAATGCRKQEGNAKNMYATGKVTMAMVDELSSNGSASAAVNGIPTRGCFVMWQMVPNKWLIELVVAGHKVVAGSDGNVAWRRTPWIGSHTAKGGVRSSSPTLSLVSRGDVWLHTNQILGVTTRIAFVITQGLDPMALSDAFSLAQYMGEKKISDVDCFVLKLSADHTDLAARSDPTAEMIKRVMFGYFSQRNGLLVYLEDSYLTRIQSPGTHPTYWETTMGMKIEDYRTVEGVMIAHSGQSSAIITRFGDNLRAGPAITRMEEMWTIVDIVFNVPGLSVDCFIPPQDMQRDYPEENLDWRSTLQGSTMINQGN